MNRAIIEKELTQGVVPIGTPKAYQYEQALVESAVATVQQGITDITVKAETEKAELNSYAETQKTEISTLGQGYVDEANIILNAIRNEYGYPFVASTVADMTDPTKIYVYVGSETGYVNGDWYYYDGTAWVSGGVYNAVVVQTDTTLTQAGVPADAKATGDAIALKPNADPTLTISGDAADSKVVGDNFRNTIEVTLGTNLVDPTKFTVGAIMSDGTISTSSSYATYNTSDFVEVEANTDYYFACYNQTPPQTAKSWRKLLLLYDATKTPIADTHQNAEASVLTFNSSTNVKYVRVSSRNTADLQLAKGTTAGSYVPYEEITRVIAKLGDVPMQQVADSVEDVVDAYNVEHKVPVKWTKQLFDRSAVTVGYCATNGNITTSITDYVYTPLIDVSAHGGEFVYFSIDGVAKGARFVTAYDSAQQVLGNDGMDNGSLTAIPYTIPNTVKYIRITYKNPSTNPTYVNFQAEYNEITGYTPYGKYFTYDGRKVGNCLWNKKWAVCGDSFTNGANSGFITDEGRYCGYKKVYPYFIGNRNNMNIVSFFLGGRTLAYPSDGTFHNSLTDPTADCYYQNIPADVDYITIYLGINDGNHSVGSSDDGEDTTGYIGLGTIDDNTTATYYGAWNVVLTWLITNRPFAHIGIIVSNGVRSNEWRMAQINIAKKYGVQYMDLNGDQFSPAMLRTVNPDIPSSVKQALIQKQAVDPDGNITGTINRHPNDQAHEYESYNIEAFLRRL